MIVRILLLPAQVWAFYFAPDAPRPLLHGSPLSLFYGSATAADPGAAFSVPLSSLSFSCTPGKQRFRAASTTDIVRVVFGGAVALELADLTVRVGLNASCLQVSRTGCGTLPSCPS